MVGSGTWEVEFIAGLNQADHRVAGLATIDAVRDAGNRWVFPELLGEGLAPHGTRWLLAGGGTRRPTHGVEVTGAPLGTRHRLSSKRTPNTSPGCRVTRRYVVMLGGDHAYAGTGDGRAERGALPGLGLPGTAAHCGRDR